VFDVLHINGISLRDCALVDRKSVLVELLRGQRGPVRISDHLYGGGEALFKRACRLELEGLVSKRKDAKYRSGRNADWTKRTCRQRETFVLAGIAFNRGKFDGIYLGRRENGELVYAGKVENGFNTSVEKSLRKRAEKLKTNIQPLTRKIKSPKQSGSNRSCSSMSNTAHSPGQENCVTPRSKASVRIFKRLVGGLRSRAGGNAARYSAFGLQA
jgi:ATP-dependent DNA ligase